MAKRGCKCTVGRLATGSKVAIGVGVVAVALGAVYFVYRTGTKAADEGGMFQTGTFASSSQQYSTQELQDLAKWAQAHQGSNSGGVFPQNF